MAELLDVPGLRDTSRRFKRQLVLMAKRIGADPSYLAAVMSFESALNPAAKNPSSGASGLIQITTENAKALGTTAAAIRRMTRVQQLPLIERYFKRAGAAGRMRSVSDHYMGVFAPAFIGRGDDAVIYSEVDTDPKKYAQNRKLDRDENGAITVGEAARIVRNIVSQAETKPRLVVSDKTPSAPLIYVIGAGALLVWSLLSFKRVMV